MATDTAETDARGDPEWDTCEADDCTDDAVCGIRYRLLDEDGDIVGIGNQIFCAYHCAINERDFRAADDYELDRITAFPDSFDTWTPARRYQTYNIQPEYELRSLVNYLKAQDATGHTALESRRIGVEAALSILNRETDMHGVVEEWDEPWKVR